jgi:hypothetical protein
MLSAISQKIYETLSQDSVLQGLLPNVKDSSNVWEMRVPDPVADNKYPLIVFRVVTATPLLTVESLDALNWFVEIDIVGNKSTMSTLYSIFDRVYALLQTSNMSSGVAKAYQCKLDFMTTEYDKQTLSTFILTRWQIYSLDSPSTKLSNS